MKRILSATGSSIVKDDGILLAFHLGWGLIEAILFRMAAGLPSAASGRNTMADLWYYTQEGRAQDPVTKRELQQLAGAGLLKPNDLVWTEGMPQWIRASVAGGLFAEDTLTGTGRSTSWDSSRHSTAQDLVRRSEVDLVRRQPRDEDDRTDIYDDAYEQPDRRRRGLSSGAKAGIIAGVVVG